MTLAASLRRIAATLGLAPLCLAAALSVPANAKVFDPETFTLDNGMQVVLVRNHRVPAVVQMVWYKVGAADEEWGKSGLAHFLEHLMFKGTPSVPPGAFSPRIARTGGRDNAFTSQDYTAYYQVVAADRLAMVMEMEADRMRNLQLDDSVVLPERDVILEERRSRIENQPSAQLSVAMTAALFFNHPYRVPVIGWAEEMAKLSTEDALAFYRRHYAPDNAILVVAGDVTMDVLKPLAEKYYGVIPAAGVPARVRPPEPEHHTGRRVVLHSDRVREPLWRRVYAAPSYGTADPASDAYALEVLDEILGGGTTGRLYRSLVVEQGIASSAGSWYSPDAIDLGTAGLYASPVQGGSMAAVEDAVDAQIAALLAEGVTAEEVDDAKRRLQAGAIFARDSLENGAQVLGRALASGRTVEDVEKWPERIGAVTPEQVLSAARGVFRPERAVTGELLPEPAAGGRAGPGAAPEERT